MGRTKSPISTKLNAEVSLSDDLNASLDATTQHRMGTMQQFGDSQPYEYGRTVHEARSYAVQSVGVIPEADKRLIILKEDEPYGDFTGIVKERLGLHVRAAQRMMKISLKCPPPKLEPKVTTSSLLDKAKLFESAAEDDDDLAELIDGDTVAGLTLDDADHMSVRKLRRALYEARETNAAQQRVPTDKNEKIDSLSTRLKEKSRTQLPESNEEVKKLRAEVTVLTAEVESAIAVRPSSTFETLYAYCAENVIDTPRDFMADLACQLGSAARNLRSTFDLLGEPTGNAAPSWLTGPTLQINGLEV